MWNQLDIPAATLQFTAEVESGRTLNDQIKKDLQDSDRGNFMHANGCLCGLVVAHCLVITG